MSKPPSVIPWSYSSLTAFETCPKRFFITRISKQVQEPQTEATIHGNAVHKALEEYIGGKAPMPAKYESYLPVADKVRDTPGEKLLEYKFGLTAGLQPTTFFAKDCWARGVIDVGIKQPNQVILLDWKTGKRKADHDQLDMFALAALSLYPSARKIKTGYIWLQTHQMDSKEYSQDDKSQLAQGFAARAFRLEEAHRKGEWPANPSGLCRAWCPVGRALCVHCGK